MENKIGTKFVELLRTIGDFSFMKNPSYTDNALNKFKTYKSNLNKIHLKKFNNSQQNNKDYIINYISKFLMEIFYRVSNINYPGEK